jgi:hypothetical protein
VSDLSAAGAELDRRYGLRSVEGGRHPGWGTANRIVPLWDCYLELVSVVDAREAAKSPFGRWVAGNQTTLPTPFAWAVRTPDMDVTTRHHGLRAVAGARTRPDGTVLRWRTAGIEEATREPSLPFFMEWAPDAEQPGRTGLGDDGADVRVVKLQLRGDAARIAEWLGPHELPVVVHRGAPAVTRVVLAGTEGEIVLRGGR